MGGGVRKGSVSARQGGVALLLANSQRMREKKTEIVKNIIQRKDYVILSLR